MQTYFALHGLPLEEFFKYWHTLVYVEGVIYQADEDNEQAAGGQGEQPPSTAGERALLLHHAEPAALPAG